VTIGDRPTAKYSLVASQSITFGPRGRWAFAAARSDARGKKRWYVVSNGGESRAWDGVAEIQFTANGKLLYAAEEGAKWRVVVDGRSGPRFDGIVEQSVSSSSRGTRVGYIATKGRCQVAVTGNTRSPCARDIVDYALGESHEFDAVLARVEPGDAADLFVGERHVARFTSPRAIHLDDSTRRWAVVAAAETERGFQLVTEHERGPIFDDIGSVVWAPAGRDIAYTARRRAEWFVIFGSERSQSYRRIEGPVFSKDGQRLGWIGRSRTHSDVVVDGRTLWRAPAEASALQFDPTGERVAWTYAAKSGSVIAVGRERFPFDIVVKDSLCFSRDGRHWAALAGDRSHRKLFIVVDGRRAVAFDATEFFGGGIRDTDPVIELRAWVEAELARFLAGGALPA
jgi:hypothetical protein